MYDCWAQVLLFTAHIVQLLPQSAEPSTPDTVKNKGNLYDTGKLKVKGKDKNAKTELTLDELGGRHISHMYYFM